MLEFAKAIRASDNPDPGLEYIVTSLNEWQQPQDRRAKSRKTSGRTPDEGREGYSYRLLRWPALVLHAALLRVNLGVDFGSCLANVASVRPHVSSVLNCFRICYFAVRIYVHLTEFFITWYSPTNSRLIKSGEELDSKIYVFP